MGSFFNGVFLLDFFLFFFGLCARPFDVLGIDGYHLQTKHIFGNLSSFLSIHLSFVTWLIQSVTVYL